MMPLHVLRKNVHYWCPTYGLGEQSCCADLPRRYPVVALCFTVWRPRGYATVIQCYWSEKVKLSKETSRGIGCSSVGCQTKVQNSVNSARTQNSLELGCIPSSHSHQAQTCRSELGWFLFIWSSLAVARAKKWESLHDHVCGYDGLRRRSLPPRSQKVVSPTGHRHPDGRRESATRRGTQNHASSSPPENSNDSGSHCSPDWSPRPWPRERELVPKIK